MSAIGEKTKVKLEGYDYLQGVTGDMHHDIVNRFGGDDASALTHMLQMYRDCIVREMQQQRCVMHALLTEEPI